MQGGPHVGPPTKRSRVRRVPDRGQYDRATIDKILDEGLVAHVATAGTPVIPMGYVRDGDRLLLHGSSASRLMRSVASGAEACVTVTLLDGLVLARSAFHHSMNFRSVVLQGRGRAVEEGEEKAEALRVFLERLFPGRWKEVRRPDEAELRATSVVSFPLDEASAKIRAGPPVDEADDQGWSVWAGVVPLRLAPGPPEQDPGQAAAPWPPHLARWIM